jgi:hypothetical protein
MATILYRLLLAILMLASFAEAGSADDSKASEAETRGVVVYGAIMRPWPYSVTVSTTASEGSIRESSSDGRFVVTGEFPRAEKPATEPVCGLFDNARVISVVHLGPDVRCEKASEPPEETERPKE